MANPTYSEAFTYSTDTTFIGRVVESMLKAAEAIMAEASTTAGHKERCALALQVLQNPDSWKQKFAYAVCATPTILGLISPLTATNPTDAQIDTAISSIWSAMAGYFAN
jgi:hypothetical protein